ncbi:MAG: D-aminoacylase [Anaerolineaceae bacterium]|nr:D-aminoacylase [Anaerolineaceae bacterium]
MTADYDILIRNAALYDGSGSDPIKADLAIQGPYIAEIGSLSAGSACQVIDAQGLAVAPGFINIMSWAPIDLLIDGRSQSDIRQGVTLEVFGEGWSEGPLTEKMKQEVLAHQGDLRYEMPWNTLGEYLEHLQRRGVSTNFGSFVGADTVRIHVIGFDNRPPNPAELDQMRSLVHQAMQEGALGIATALIYTPGTFSSTEELVELSKVVSQYNGIYISHMRSEGARLLEAVDELIRIARAAHIRAEIYHLKALGEKNWAKMEQVLEKVEAARAGGLEITADMYTYTAGATGLDACMPAWVQEGGHDAWIARLKDPAVREKLRLEISAPDNDWENMYQQCGGGKNMLLMSFKNESLKPLTGKTLAEVAELRARSEIDTMIDLVIEDDTRVGTVFFNMLEDNLRKQLLRPWVCLGSDAGSLAPEGIFLKSGVHPRSYGNFARFLSKYVREEQLMPLQEAVRRLTSLPANTLKLEKRGLLKPGYYGDVVVFDPQKIQDWASYANPHQYSTGVVHVFVNGQQVLQDGQHTGAVPGMIVRGPGWKK